MSESFKTFVLNNCDIDSKIYPFDDLDEAYKVKEILNVLMSALNATIKKYLDNDSNLSDGYNIEEIHFACPNLSQKDDINDESTLNKYIETLRHVIECAFGSTVDISVHLEGLFGIELVTALLGKKSNEYTNIITIDIGAGTTDNAISVNSTAHESSKKNDMDVICLNSAYFGAQNIDEIIVNSANNIKGGNNYDYLKKNPYAICNIKKWLFESGNVDDKIDSRLEENKSYLKSAVINEMNIMDNFRNYEHMIDNISQKLCKIKNDNSSFLVVLLGGTSRISFLKDEIENNFKKKHLKFKIKYLYELVDETHHQDINDANFMAYAAAHNNTYPKCFSRSAPKAKIETKFISVIQRVGAPNIIAVKLVGGNYAIIASPDPEGNPYFLTKDAYRSVNVREEDDKEVKTYPPTFDLKSVLYYFSTNETIPDDTTELKTFSEKSSMYTCIPSKTNITCLTRHNLTSYIGEKKKLPRNNVICRYIGSFYNYDPSISLDKALEIMTYNNDTL